MNCLRSWCVSLEPPRPTDLEVIGELNSIYSLESHPLTLAAIFETTKDGKHMLEKIKVSDEHKILAQAMMSIEVLF